MNIVESASRVLARSAEATTSAAGAVGGAVVSGVVGGVRGTVTGIRAGLSDGSQSTSTAALTLAAVGAAGLVEWPVLLGVGGTALVIRQLNRRPAPSPSTPTLAPVEDLPASSAAPAPATRRKSANGAAKATAPRTPRKSSASGRRTPADK